MNFETTIRIKGKLALIKAHQILLRENKFLLNLR